MQPFPFLHWWKEVNSLTLKADLQAGLVGAVVVLPQSVAFATIAGMPPEYGLFTGMIPAIIAALFGSSFHLVSGPTTAASLVLFSSLSLMAEPGSQAYVQLALTLTFMVGIIQVFLGLVRFGSLVNFISHSVVVGFTAGAAILIIASQAKHFFGLDYPRAAHFQETLHNLFLHIHEANLYAIAVGLVTIVSGILCKTLWPKLPNMIISMLIGSLAAAVLSAFFGKETTAIATVGALPSQLPPFSSPQLTLENIKLLAPTALAMTLFALTEAISIARALADKANHELDGNQEFIGQGLSNIFGSFFSGYVATGSFNRSSMNYEAGARTPLSAIFSGIFLIPVVLYVAPFASYLPNTVIAAILFLVAWRLIDISHIIKIFRTSKTESLILGATFVATLFLELQFAILLGILLSLAVYLNRTSHPKVVAEVPNPSNRIRSFAPSNGLPECPQLKIVRFDGSLYFGAVHHVRDEVHTHLKTSGQDYLLIIASGINFIDMAGADFLLQLRQEREKAGGALFFCDIKENICSHCSFSEFEEGIGPDNIFTTKNQAIAQIFPRLDQAVCAQCPVKIFEECQEYV